MEEKKTSIASNGLIWFGASVSIAELLTGTLIAPLGLAKGVTAIVLGHLIGCTMLYFAGLIGANTGESAMGTVKLSFGKKGAIFFAIMNVLQLLGWTAVMTGQGANAAISASGNWMNNNTFWVLAIGFLIVMWILIGVVNISNLNALVMAALFVMTLILSVVVFRSVHLSGQMNLLTYNGSAENALSFGAAVELSAAMPVSWLPLISDYTRNARHPAAATLVSTIVYFIGSCWMFIIGMVAAIFTGTDDIPGILTAAGFGTIGLLIVILSTVTTTFLDSYSAGVSLSGIGNVINEKPAAVIIAVMGTAVAVFAPLDNLESFLYLISAVFTPMIAILITDTFLIKKDRSKSQVCIQSFIIWAAGFVIYRFFLNVDTPLGNTLPVVLIVMCLSLAVEFLSQLFHRIEYSETINGKIPAVKTGRTRHVNVREKDLKVYAVSDRRWLKNDTSLEDAVEQAIQGGATMIQLREKELPEDEFIELAQKVKLVTDKYKVPLIINDNIHVAVKCKAAGVHLGQSDMSVSEARGLIGGDKIIGVSARTLEQARKAEADSADYLGIGAVFDTSSKNDAEKVSLDTLREICNDVNVPAVAIGGIYSSNVSLLAGSGIKGVAVVSAIFAAENIKEATERLTQSVEEMLKDEAVTDIGDLFPDN